MAEEKVSVEQLREQGNAAVRNSKYEEAILVYTYAIKLEPTNSALYSNRSLAFLKVQQYYFAMEDAIQTIKLNSTWAKGYFRKAEVEFATFRYEDALNSYQEALRYQPDDTLIVNAMMKTVKEQQKDMKADSQIPWLGAGVGIVLGVMIVIADYLCTNKPTLTHPVLMAIMTMAIAMIGYGVARVFRYYEKCRRSALLETPIDLEKENSSDDASNSTTTNTAPRYTKSQARQRWKKGKS